MLALSKPPSGSLATGLMDFSSSTSLAGLAEVIGAVQGAASRVGCSVYLAGALARDLRLAVGAGIDTGRKTEDIDFAVECADWATFERLAEELAVGGVRRTNPSILHKFRHPNGGEIDVIPFGGLEGPGHTLVWPPEGDRAMNLLGFADVLAATSAVRLPSGIEVQVATLPALALLKILAWEDRGRTQPGKDAPDLYLIGKHYLDAREPGVPEEEKGRLLEPHRFDEKLAGAELLGRDMAALGSPETRHALAGILEREADPDGPLALARALNRYDVDEALAFLAALRDGLHTRPPGPGKAGHQPREGSSS